MIVAIPTINGKLIARRFKQMTEITFLRIENNQLTDVFEKHISPPKEHCENREGENEYRECKRHGEIQNALTNSDELWYKALCKNWRKNLSDKHLRMKRISEDTLEEIKAKLFKHEAM